jgi:hypothetical protein
VELIVLKKFGEEATWKTDEIEGEEKRILL